jgi:hypothetical protein
MLNPIRMFSESQYRDLWEGIKPGTCDVTPVGNNINTGQTFTPSNWTPLAPYLVNTLQERKSGNVDGNANDWKPFCHHKVVTGLPVSQPRLFYPTGQYVTSIDNSQHLYHVVEVHGDPLFPYGDAGSVSGGPPISGLPSFEDTTLPEGRFIPQPGNLDDVKQMALSAILPLLKPQLSLVNSIIELKDFESVPRTLKGLYKFAFLGKRSVREAFRVGSDSYLQMQFNFLPLISDVKGIISSLQRTNARINELIRRSGQPQVRHFDYSWGEFTDGEDHVTQQVDGLAFQYASIAGNVTRHRYVSYDMSRVHIELDYNYNYSQYQIENARILSLLDALGVNLNPAIVWNAIKWSFVVDWVFGVSRWLSQFAQRNMALEINIRRALWSIKRKRRIGTFLDIGCDTGLPWINGSKGIPQRTCIESAYRRELWMPSLSSIISSGLSPKEVSLGAALVLARDPRRKSRKAR